MNLRPIVVATLFLALAANAPAQSAGQIHKRLTAEGERLRPWASDKMLVEAIKAQNARKVPLATIQQIDAEWRGGTVLKQITTSACANRLRELAKQQPYYVEVFVSDDQGALVCANSVTSDYWQGDEPKWIRSFNDGKGTLFIDRPRYDESAKATLAAISLPILDGEKTIGVITVGVITEKLPAE
jgi:hypothetical protein